jgi:hypothetical protein
MHARKIVTRIKSKQETLILLTRRRRKVIIFSSQTLARGPYNMLNPLKFFSFISAALSTQAKTCINELTVRPTIKAGPVSSMGAGVYNATGGYLFLTALYNNDGSQVFDLLPQGYDGCLDGYGPGEYTLRNAACRPDGTSKSECFQTFGLTVDKTGNLTNVSMLAPVQLSGSHLQPCKNPTVSYEITSGGSAVEFVMGATAG